MGKKLMSWKTKGMNQDLSVSAFNPEFAFENMNLRLSTNEGNTLMSWVNEKGTAIIEFTGSDGKPAPIKGTPLGIAVINHKLILFTHEEKNTINNDRIYIIEKNSNNYSATEAYLGNLDFDLQHPLETLVSFEAVNIEKVYWTDGKNQPRMAIISNLNKTPINNLEITADIDTRFDFVTTEDLNSAITVTKRLGGGTFNAGIILYCYTYFNKYAQQSNIINVSPIYYLTHFDRGAKPGDSVSNSFEITITNPDKNFQYIRLYSIQRTSLNDVPYVLKLEDLPIPTEGSLTTVSYIDTGSNGSTMDPTELLFVGGKEITALTMTDKDNTLFLGNIKPLNSDISKILKYYNENKNIKILFHNDKVLHLSDATGNLYSNTFTLNNSKNNITTFKGGDWYRLGFQLLKYTGEWSDPIFINDYKNDKYPKTSINSTLINLVLAKGTIDFTPFIDEPDYQIEGFKNIYKRIRPVVVYPSVNDRVSLYQGVLNPTVFNIDDRKEKLPYALASWYFRPYTIDVQQPTSAYEVLIKVNSTTGANGSSSSNNRYSIMLLRIKTKELDHYLTSYYIDFEDGRGSGNEQYWYYAALKLGTVNIKDNTNDLYTTEFTDILFWLPADIGQDDFIANSILSGHNWGAPNERKKRLTAWTCYNGGSSSTHNYYELPDGVERDSGGFLKYTGNQDYVTIPFKFTNDNFDYGTGEEYSGKGFVGEYTITLYAEREDDLASRISYKHYESIYTDNNFNYKNTLEDYNQYTSTRAYCVRDTKLALQTEIQGSIEKYQNPYSLVSDSSIEYTNNQFFVDLSIVTLNSPDLEFDTLMLTYNSENLKLRIIGMIPITSNASAHRISVTGAMYPLNYQEKDHEDNVREGNGFGIGELPINVYKTNISELASLRLVSGYLWQDSHLGFDKEKIIYSGSEPVEYLVYPWQSVRSFTNDKRRNENACSVLKTKTESTMLYSYNTLFFLNYQESVKLIKNNNTQTINEYLFKNNNNEEGIVSTQIHLKENEFIENLRLNKQSPLLDNINYYPNIEKTLVNDIPWNIRSKYTSLYGNYTSPVLMKYKSGTHSVIALPEYSNDTSNSIINILPSVAYISNNHRRNAPSREINTGGSDRGITTIQQNSMGYVVFGDEPTPPNELPENLINVSNGNTNQTPINYDVGQWLENQSLRRIRGVYQNPSSTMTFWGDNISFNLDQIEISEDMMDKFYDFLWLGELYKEVDESTLFGGTGEAAIKSNNWMPAGEAKAISENSNMVELVWTEGDTYYQRYDCLKTYPFTIEDPNQLVEILSFMCETHVNLDGRYDRNRGLKDNTNILPTNFNLINDVYSQLDNFFSYKKYLNKVNEYPNLVTFTKTKTAGADIDLWTNITLASNLDLDGDKGEITSLQRFNDQLIAFQDTGISLILYNENVQIASTAGVPIEIANSGKVQGKRYLSNSIGCSNKWSIANTPSGIYFIDSNDKGIYIFNGLLNNLSNKFGFNSWCKNNIKTRKEWNPYSFEDFVTYYDKSNQEVLFINKNKALAFSEKLALFTSFYSYENTPYFCNLDDEGIWISKKRINNNSYYYLWKHNKGEYNKFFEKTEPYSMTLVGNPEPQLDKTFTNLEFRACVESDGQEDDNKFNFILPFDSIETWNEYQHGQLSLELKDGKSASLHHEPRNNTSSLKRKFRIWRCDIPRDNYNAPESNNELGISRYKAHPMDRMRNPWIYIKLLKNEPTNKTEIHDLVMTYFD